MKMLGEENQIGFAQPSVLDRSGFTSWSGFQSYERNSWLEETSNRFSTPQMNNSFDTIQESVEPVYGNFEFDTLEEQRSYEKGERMFERSQQREKNAYEHQIEKDDRDAYRAFQKAERDAYRAFQEAERDRKQREREEREEKMLDMMGIHMTRDAFSNLSSSLNDVSQAGIGFLSKF